MNTLKNNAHWLLRIALASVFVYHGFLKLGNLQAFADMLPIGYGLTVVVALLEAGGGLLVLAGGFGNGRGADLATRIGAALNIPVMIVAIWLVHWGQWNFVPTETHPMGGAQFQVVLALVMAYLVVVGNGAIPAVGARASRQETGASPAGAALTH